MSAGLLDICIGIVSGNNREMTLECLRSLIASISDDLRFEIHFVDNAAPEHWFNDVRSLSPILHVHRNERRKGFGANHNMIISGIDAKYYLLLNDDTYVYPGFCEELVRQAEANPECGFFGPKLLNTDGTIQRSVYRFPTPLWAAIEALQLNKFFGGWRMFNDYRTFAYEQICPVDFVSGAALLARKEMLDQIGLLDEGFFMYAEEADWCFRAKQRNWATLFIPGACITHHGGQSTLTLAPERSVEFLRSHARLIRKHFGEAGLLLYRWCNLIKHLPRMLYAKIADLPQSKQLAEQDIVLWSLGLLKRSGLSEIAKP